MAKRLHAASVSSVVKRVPAYKKNQKASFDFKKLLHVGVITVMLLAVFSGMARRATAEDATGTPDTNLVSTDSVDQDGPSTVFHLIKVICPSYSDITGNGDADQFDATGGHFTEFNNYSSSSPHFVSPYPNKPVDPSEIPQNCVRTPDWHFLFSTDQAQTENTALTDPTDANGEVSFTLPHLWPPVADAYKAGQKIWLSEVTQPSADFGAIRCSNDALNGDNLEFLQQNGEVAPSDIYCIAYNVGKVKLPPPPEPCVEGPAHAFAVVDSSQGTKNDGSAIIDVTRTNASSTLGATDGTFFSLGKGGSVTLSFNGYAVDVAGIDLMSHEITNGRDTYPEERAKVYISQDNVNYFLIGEASSKDAGGISSLDFASTGKTWAKYVRLVDDTDFGPMPTDADGYDLDAIDITQQTCVQPCTTGPAHAFAVVSSDQGTLNNGSAITDPTRTNASSTLGAADGSFFSLGKGGGSVILSFQGYAMNMAGIDLVSHEITNGRDTYPEERAKVYISQDNVTYFLVGEASSKDAGGVSSLDFASTGLGWAKYVKLVDDTDFGPMPTDADGYDLDAVDVTYQSCDALTLKKTGSFDNTTDTITYKIDWAVVGTGSTNVTITDPISASTTFVSADNGGTFSAGTVTWNLGSHSAGDSGTVSLVVSVNPIPSYAVVVVDTKQGTNKNGSAVVVNRSDPSKALGAPQGTGAAFDNPAGLDGTFYSLGFNPQGDGGYATFSFSGDVVDRAGPDIQVFETTYGPPYPDEIVRVEAGNSTSSLVSLGNVTKDGTVDLAMGGLSSAKYIKVTDVSDKSLFEDTADGYDLDAIKALSTGICSIDNTATVTWGSGDFVFNQSSSVTVTVDKNACGNPDCLRDCGSGGPGGGEGCTIDCNPGGGGTEGGTTTMFTLLVSTTADEGATGTVSSDVGGINCGSTCSASYASGTPVTLTAHPGENSSFVGTWTTGPCIGSDNPVCSFVMDSNKAANAHFSVAQSGGGNQGGGGGPVTDSIVNGGGTGSGGSGFPCVTNCDNTGGGGGGGTGTTTGGSVLGTSTNPSNNNPGNNDLGEGGSNETPQVLGATTLPRTGMPVLPFLALLLFAGLVASKKLKLI